MNQFKLAIIGLGYTGLPLARLFATKYPVIGYDINNQRVQELSRGIDKTLEVNEALLKSVLKNDGNANENGLFFTNNLNNLTNCNCFIISVPTPVDKHNKPDLSILLNASKTVGKVLSKNSIVIFESTVYPGATEEECIPEIENISGLKFNTDFFVGYSPERINPGDKTRTVEKVKKVTSGSTPEIAQIIDNLYCSVIEAGTHLAPSIKVAEAAKVIENAQRDINIAFVNELAKIFNRLEIDTNDVLEAAGTKWNFLNFKPGLVGGHCIGVDPYYLAQKAEEIGYHPEIILSGRRVNDSMGIFIANEVVKLMVKADIPVKSANALILGITFKENCTDIRNTKVVDIYHELKSYGIDVSIYDPMACSNEVKEEYNIELLNKLDNKKYNAVILAVAHNEFKEINIESLTVENCSVVYDIKSFLDKSKINGRL